MDVLLASEADLIARVGSLTDEQRARVPGLLADASAEIREAAGQQITFEEYDIARVQPVDRKLRLRERPVSAVHSVRMHGETSLLPESAWAWDGLDVVRLVDSETPAGPYDVMYSHGYHKVPDFVIGITCGAVNRVLTAGAVIDGVTGQSAGPFSVQTAGSVSGVQVRLTSREEKRLKRRFGRSSGIVLTGRT